MVTGSAQPSWSAILAVQRAAHVTVHILASELARLGLAPAEINVLANLAGGRGLTASRLGAAAGIRPTTLTSVLDRLEGRGLISRDRVPGDRRAVLIALTPGGRQAAAAVREAVAGLEARALGELPDSAVGGLRAGLEALAEVSP